MLCAVCVLGMSLTMSLTMSLNMSRSLPRERDSDGVAVVERVGDDGLVSVAVV